ncbi:MAG: hypothetical protein ACYDCC_14130 [Actinomycetota bacterium]
MKRCATAAALGMLLGFLLMSGAHATTEDRVTVRYGASTSRTYSDLVGEEPATDPPSSFQEVDPAPEHCASPRTYCDAIPFDVVMPPVPDGAYVSLSIELSWKAESVNAATTSSPLADLEMILYSDQGSPAQHGASMKLGEDKSDSDPKILSLTNPNLGQYSLVVWNNFKAPAKDISFVVRWTLSIVEFQAHFHGGGDSFVSGSTAARSSERMAPQSPEAVHEEAPGAIVSAKDAAGVLPLTPALRATGARSPALIAVSLAPIPALILGAFALRRRHRLL